jgi:hypothetical protein
VSLVADATHARQFRLRQHSPSWRLGRESLLGVCAARGIQDTTPGSAGIALAARIEAGTSLAGGDLHLGRELLGGLLGREPIEEHLAIDPADDLHDLA